MNDDDNNDDMGKEDRRDVVLEFMMDHPLALKPIDIFRNLRAHRNITFSSDSVTRYLAEFEEEGLVMRVDPHKMEDGEIAEADDETRAQYIITEKGRKSLEKSEKDSS